MSSSQVLDWLVERHPNLNVGESTIRYYVGELREAYHIPKVKTKRDYEAIHDLQPLHAHTQSMLKVKAEKRDVSEYVSILRGALG